jgi:hypothetical protein
MKTHDLIARDPPMASLATSGLVGHYPPFGHDGQDPPFGLIISAAIWRSPFVLVSNDIAASLATIRSWPRRGLADHDPLLASLWPR